MHLAALIVISTLAASSPRIAFMGLAAGEGVTESTATSLSDALAADLRKQWEVELITPRELSAVITVERQKALLGCDSTSCVAEIAGALDVAEVVTGSVARLGESWLLQVQRVDAKKAVSVAHASRRTRGAVDALLDELPPLVRELTGGSAQTGVAAQAGAAQTGATQTGSTQTGATQAAAPQLPPPAALSPPWSNVELKNADPSKLVVVREKKSGLVIAIEPYALTNGLFLAGDENGLYAQRVFGGGSEAGKRYDVVFWEPRAKSPAQASFGYQDGRYTLTCGDQTLEFHEAPKAFAKKLLKRGKLYDVRWQRRAWAIARDDDGNYFVIDRARQPEDSLDFRMYVGTRGAMNAYSAEPLAQDSGGEIFKSAAGKLKLDYREKKASWTPSGAAEEALTLLDIDGQARFVYSQLGTYAGQPLGTPCDATFGSGGTASK